MLYRQTDLAAYHKIRINEHVERMVYYPLGGIFYRHHTVIGAALFNLGEYVGYGANRHECRACAEVFHGRLVRISGLRAEICDGKLLFQRPACVDDLPENGFHRGGRKRPPVSFNEPGNNIFLTMRHVNVGARFYFQRTDGFYQFGALANLTEDAPVNPINFFPDFIYFHNWL